MSSIGLRFEFCMVSSFWLILWSIFGCSSEWLMLMRANFRQVSRIRIRSQNQIWIPNCFVRQTELRSTVDTHFHRTRPSDLRFDPFCCC